MPSASLGSEFREDWVRLVWSPGDRTPPKVMSCVSLPAFPGWNATNQISQKSIPEAQSNAWSLHMPPESHGRGEDLVLWASAASVPTCFLVARACPEPELFHWTVITINIYKNNHNTYLVYTPRALPWQILRFTSIIFSTCRGAWHIPGTQEMSKSLTPCLQREELSGQETK